MSLKKIYFPTALLLVTLALPSMARGDSTLNGTLEAYVAFALQHHPRLSAIRHASQAATHQGDGVGTLPDPVVSYSYYARSVETRVGPQRHRVGVQQTIPWPSGLRAERRAQRLGATALDHDTENLVHQIVSGVTQSFWTAWSLEQERALTSEQRALLQSVAESSRARLEVGQSSLAALTQIELSVSRLEDALASLTARKEMALEALRASVGAPMYEPLALSDSEPVLPTTPEIDELLSRVSPGAHPSVAAIRARERVEGAHADRAWAKRLPALRVGVDLIETGSNPAAGPTSGKDPVILTIAAALPLWQRSYSSSQRAAEIRQQALAATREAALVDIRSEVAQHVISLKNSRRRVELYANTLIPQARAAFDSVSGAFQTGRAQVADVLLAQRELLELQIGVVRSRTEGVHHWAALRYWAAQGETSDE